MNPKQFAALTGFAFVATWAGLSLATAILALVVAALAWAGAAVMQGELDLGELQDRATGGRAR